MNGDTLSLGFGRRPGEVSAKIPGRTPGGTTRQIPRRYVWGESVPKTLRKLFGVDPQRAHVKFLTNHQKEFPRLL